MDMRDETGKHTKEWAYFVLCVGAGICISYLFFLVVRVYV